MYVDLMYVYQMSVNLMSVDQMFVGQMSVNQMSDDQIIDNQMSIAKCYKTFYGRKLQIFITS